MANHHIRKSFLLSVRRFLQSSAQLHESARNPLQRATHHIKGTHIPLVRVVNMKYELHNQKIFIPSQFYYGEMHCAKRWTKID